MKFGRLDQLEVRMTITEPISVLVLALGSLSGLADRIMKADGGNSGLLGVWGRGFHIWRIGDLRLA